MPVEVRSIRKAKERVGCSQEAHIGLEAVVHIKEVERALKLDLKDNDSAGIVDSLPGFGVITSHGFLAEVGELDRFPHPREPRKVFRGQGRSRRPCRWGLSTPG